MNVIFEVRGGSLGPRTVTVEVPDGLAWYDARDRAMWKVVDEVCGPVPTVLMGAGGICIVRAEDGAEYLILPVWPEALR